MLELPGGSICAHDFKASALCELPVKVVLRNTSRIFSVSLTSDATTCYPGVVPSCRCLTSPPPSLVWQAMVHVDASRNVSATDGVHGCMWAGITRLKAELGPGEERNLDLKAAFTQVRYAHTS